MQRTLALPLAMQVIPAAAMARDLFTEDRGERRCGGATSAGEAAPRSDAHRLTNLRTLDTATPLTAAHSVDRRAA